jgi:hypothetical protein
MEKRPVFSEWERRTIYDILMGMVERISLLMNAFGKSAREAAWRTAVDYRLRPRGSSKALP